MLSLLYGLLDEFLFRFSAEDNMVCREVRIVAFDREAFTMTVQGWVPTSPQPFFVRLSRLADRTSRFPPHCWDCSPASHQATTQNPY